MNMKRKSKTTVWERNEDLVQRLLDNPDFQGKIIALRKKWGIPKKGYKNDSSIWEERIGELTDEYYKNKRADDLKLWKESEKKALNREITWPEYEKIKDKVHYNIPINGFFHDIDTVIEDLGISPTWRDGVKRYILFNTIKSMRLPGGISFSMAGRDFPDIITITIDAHTTWQDMNDRWLDIEREQKKLRHSSYKKYQPYPSFPLHKKLHDLKKSGMKTKEISEKTGVPYHYINTYIKRYLEHVNRK